MIYFILSCQICIHQLRYSTAFIHIMNSLTIIDVYFCFKSFTFVYRCEFLLQVLYICLSMCIFVLSPLHMSIDVIFCFKSFTFVFRCVCLFQVLHSCLLMQVFVYSHLQLSIDVGICLQSLTVVYRCEFWFQILYSCLSM